MRRLALIAAIAMLATACNGTTEDTTTTTTIDVGSTTTAVDSTTTTGAETTTTAGEVDGAQLAITEVVFGDSASVTITNVGSEATSLAGHFLCQRPNYDSLPDVELAAGESMTFTSGADFDIGGLLAAGGEVGLYDSTNFGSSDDIVAYVEWGSAGHGRSDVASAAGIWSGFVATTASTASISANTDPATEAGHWDAG